MKVQTTLEFTDEQRLAIGAAGERAGNERLKQFVGDCVDRALPEVMKKFYARKAEEYEKKADALD